MSSADQHFAALEVAAVAVRETPCRRKVHIPCFGISGFLAAEQSLMLVNCNFTLCV